MSMGIQNQIYYPNVTSIPGKAGAAEQAQKKREGGESEFDRTLDRAANAANPGAAQGATQGATEQRAPDPKGGVGLSRDLSQVKAPLKFSAHASQRLQERKISLGSEMMQKVNAAVDKAEAKGLEDTLVLTPDAALIVNVKNRTVITAMDRGQMTGNVFTNIDGAVLV
jgi:flagellar operon protein